MMDDVDDDAGEVGVDDGERHHQLNVSAPRWQEDPPEGDDDYEYDVDGDAHGWWMIGDGLWAMGDDGDDDDDDVDVD